MYRWLGNVLSHDWVMIWLKLKFDNEILGVNDDDVDHGGDADGGGDDERWLR